MGRALRFLGVGILCLAVILTSCDGKKEQKKNRKLRSQISEDQSYLNVVPIVLQYRQAYYEAHGRTAPKNALPATHAWPGPDRGFSYKEKLSHLLPLKDGVGVEIGPLNLPQLSKEESRILYVDHLDTEGLQKKYPTLEGIVPVDRPMVNNSLKDTLCNDAPLDFVIASQVFEHVPNPIRWLREISSVLRVGGLVALSLPDRRFTFDFYREETRASDIIAAFINDHVRPDARCIYDHYSLVSPVNMKGIIPHSLYPHEVIAGRGAVSAGNVHDNPLEYVQNAQSGDYLDAHCWVFTPPSFLLVMAHLANAGFLPFKCHQFYPTTPDSHDRGDASFTIILEKVAEDTPLQEIRLSFLKPLGPFVN